MINGVTIGGVIPTSTVASFRAVFGEKSKAFEKFQSNPQVQKAIADVKERLAKITDVEGILEDRKVTQFLLSAFSLDDEIKYPGRLKKIISEDPNDKQSLVNKLIDPRYKEIAKELGIAGLGGIGKLKFNYFVDDLAKKFVVNEFEKKLGEQDPALREAAYFRRNADKVTKALDILGDKVLRSVVTTALNIPPEAARQSIEKQESLITDKVDVKKFKDPKFIDQFLQRFLIQSDLKGGGGAKLTGKGAELLPLLSGGSSSGLTVPTTTRGVNFVV